MIVGISAKLKDRRIDRRLEKIGFNLVDCEIFYSPITVFIWYLLILIAFTAPICFFIPMVIWNYSLFFLIYFLIQYIMLAYLNNSYAIVHEKLIVINPNLPFRRMKVYELKKIEKIVIDRLKTSFLTWVFLIYDCNFVEIIMNGKRQRFYSIYLQIDCYDENITEKTLDNFNSSLKKQNIAIDFNLG